MSVYFAKCGEFLKVGHSRNPRKRVQRLRSDDTGRPLDLDKSQPVQLLRVLEGDSWDEHLAQEALSDFHIECEWFVAEPAVLAWIESLDGATFPELRRDGGRYRHVMDEAGRQRAASEIARMAGPAQAEIFLASPADPDEADAAAAEAFGQMFGHLMQASP